MHELNPAAGRAFVFVQTVWGNQDLSRVWTEASGGGDGQMQQQRAERAPNLVPTRHEEACGARVMSFVYTIPARPVIGKSVKLVSDLAMIT